MVPELGVYRKMKYLVLFMSILFLSIASAAVNEYNYFYLGEVDENGDLVKSITSVSGANIKGFVCSDSACSGSLGDMWGGEFYVSESWVKLIYPTVLQSSHGYGFWLYKDGYVPYWAKGITWAGTGTAPSVARYLSKIQDCFADVSISDFSEKNGSLSFDVLVDSPKDIRYGSIYLPSEISSHLKTLVDVDVEIRDDNWNVVWSDGDSEDIDYGGDEKFAFSTSLAPGDYTLVVSSNSAGEAQCLAYTTDSVDVVFNVYDNDKDDDGYTEDVDCDDYNPNVWQFLTGYTDSDLDSYGIGFAQNICSGLTLSGSYSIVSGDCNDSDANINPGVLEVCGDGIDNDCDGFIDEGCNSVPSVVASGNPLSGIFPLEVSFSCQGTGGDGELEYFWEFDDGGSSGVQNPMHTYLEAGEFDAVCTVSDEDGDDASTIVEIEVGKQTLEVTELVCFDEVIEGHNQSCSISVEDSFGAGAGGVSIDVYYSDDSLFGSCVSDDITGACGVKDLQGLIGSFEVSAVASKAGYFSDDSRDLKFAYDVLEEKYDIVDLKVYSDLNFSFEDYDFFRGESLFVTFGVEDLSGFPVTLDLISNVSLVSSVAGGRVALARMEKVGSVYSYKLTPVSVTHDFIGDSTVFAFVFDLIESAGGQEEVSLIIRNNLPVISPVIPSQTVKEGKSIEVNLSLYESDVEDSGENLRWEVVEFESKVDVNIVGKTLFIKGEDEGNSEVVVRLIDLDGDYFEQTFGVEVEEKGSSSCSSDWDCSSWDSCVNGLEERVCFDSSGCGGSRPIESRSCSSGSSPSSSSDTIDFSSFSTKGDGFSIWWIVVGILIVLILLILLLFLFL